MVRRGVPPLGDGVRARGGGTGQVLGLVVALVLAGVGLHQLRRNVIAAFFRDAPPGPAPLLQQAPPGTRGLSVVSRVRVLLIDGLSAPQADKLPGLRALCSQGFQGLVDTGFPTVSLPVQHVLWTGLTQTQAGRLYRLTALPEPPPTSLPFRSVNSRAVAESHPHIVKSFGFDHVWHGPKTHDDAAWAAFTQAAEAAVASDAPLAFVHVLRVDVAGHEAGARAPGYTDAAARADALLTQLTTRAPPSEHTRWFVLSDHGHRPQGGHGGAEPTVRQVRGCVAGALPKTEGMNPIHLVDLHRSLADSLGMNPDPRAPGRPFAFALHHPDEGATLPHPSAARWLAAALFLLAAFGLTLRLARTHAWLWPSWALVAYASLTGGFGTLTLSNPVVYPPFGRDLLLGALPGFVWLAWVSARQRDPFWRTVLAQVILPIAFVLASGGLCGAFSALASRQGAPPLMPLWSAHFSAAAAMLSGACFTLALVGLVMWIRRTFNEVRRTE